jgi:energy-coupling factor transport system substrate-specific component
VGRNRTQSILTVSIYLLSGLIGIAAFIYPFLLQSTQSSESETFLSRAVDAPILTIFLLVICLGVLLLEVQGQTTSAKMIAALGILVAATATLRFVEVAIPGPGGFSPIFVPIILAGYVFGARFGFLMGTLTLLVSALLTGGVGPWLPYQMYVAGWIGLTSGWLPHPEDMRFELLMLVGIGAGWGIIYGLIMNIYFWPFMAGGGSMGYESEIGPKQIIERYVLFYLTTSFVWDLARAIGNGVMMAFLALPTVRALVRFRDKFQFGVGGI